MPDGQVSVFFFFSSRRRHTRYWRDWSSDVCSSDLWRPGSRRGVDADAVRDDAAAAPGDDGRAAATARPVAGDPKGAVSGKSVDLGGRPIIQKKQVNYPMVYVARGRALSAIMDMIAA